MIFFLLLDAGMGTAFGEMVLADGEGIYKRYCAICHGENGDGFGRAAPSLSTKPTDFTSGDYKYRSTRWGSPPLNSDIERAIRNGLNGTAMPGWSDLLSSDQIKFVIITLRNFSPSKFQIQPIPLQLPDVELLNMGVEPSAIVVGKMLYTKNGCIQCHGDQGQGNGPLAGQIKDTKGRPIRPRDLTDYRNYRLGATVLDIYLRISTGLNGTPMEGYSSRMTSQEIISLSYYLKWLYDKAEKDRWSDVEIQQDVTYRGEYLVNIMVCQLCHTPINPDGSYQEGLRLAGGQKITSFPDGIYYARNLRPDPESGLGNWSIADIKLAITSGISKNGQLLYPFDMPWLFFTNLKDLDAEAIAVYLKSLDPIFNDVPQPEPSGFWNGVFNKLQFLFGRDRILEYGFVNSGKTTPKKKHNNLDSNGYWSIIPPMGWLPVKIVKKMAWTELPLPVTGSVTENVKLIRGRYLVSIVPCGLCHAAVHGSYNKKVCKSLGGRRTLLG